MLTDSTDSTAALRARCRHTVGGGVSTGRPLSCWGSQAWCLLRLQEVAVLRARFQEKPFFCPGAAGGGRRAVWETKLPVRRALPLEPALQILLCISLSLLLTGHLLHNALHHLPQGLFCHWSKPPATTRTKPVSLFSCDTPASSLTQLQPQPDQEDDGGAGRGRGGATQSLLGQRSFPKTVSIHQSQPGPGAVGWW